MIGYIADRSPRERARALLARVEGDRCWYLCPSDLVWRVYPGSAPTIYATRRAAIEAARVRWRLK